MDAQPDLALRIGMRRGFIPEVATAIANHARIAGSRPGGIELRNCAPMTRRYLVHAVVHADEAVHADFPNSSLCPGLNIPGLEADGAFRRAAIAGEHGAALPA